MILLFYFCLLYVLFSTISIDKHYSVNNPSTIIIMYTNQTTDIDSFTTEEILFQTDILPKTIETDIQDTGAGELIIGIIVSAKTEQTSEDK